MPCFMVGVLLLLIGFVAAEAAALRYWQGGWQVLALVPLVIVAAVLLVVVIDSWRDPSSHNLWPFEIALWCGAGLVVLGVVAGVRAMATRKDGP